MKKIIWIIVIIVVIMSSIGVRPVTADGTVPVEKYDALVQENQALKMARVADFEKLQDQLLGPIGNDKYSVQPVFLVPKDISVSETEIRTDILSALTAIKDVQFFYGREVGPSFKIMRPRVIKSKEPLGALERFPGANYEQTWPWQYPAVLTELDSAGFVRGTKNVYYLVFLYGKTSQSFARSPGDSGAEMVVMNDIARLYLKGSEDERRTARGLIAHELGHLFGHLPDVETKEKTIMSIRPDRSGVFLYSFPDLHFSPQEKSTLRGMMSPEEE